MICGLRKREYPVDNKCEVCGKVRKKLMYHHWDENFNVGLWVCIGCHNFVEGVDDGLVEVYLRKKKDVEGQREA